MSNNSEAVSGEVIPAMLRPMPESTNDTIVSKFAKKYGIHPQLLLPTLRQTAFRISDEKEVTDAQMLALLVVADQYDLNPFTREIFALVDKNKNVVPVVSVDGWVRIVQNHPAYMGHEFVYSETVNKTPHGDKMSYEWIACAMKRRGFDSPLEVREYFDEVYCHPRGQNQTYGPWQTHPKRMHRHKAYVQSARMAFGFAGIYDEDEAMRIIDSVATVHRQQHSVAAERAAALGAAIDGVGQSLRIEKQEDQIAPITHKASFDVKEEVRATKQTGETSNGNEEAPLPPEEA